MPSGFIIKIILVFNIFLKGFQKALHIQMESQLVFSIVLFAVLGFELRAFTLSHSTSPIFVMDFFEIGSRELFARAGFEPRSS
jgi:hypothetical protein